jgi:pantoate--beta-alanine ligase
MSSRNRYLSPAERVAARSLCRALSAGAAAATPRAALSAARAVLTAEPDLRVDYLALVDAATLDEVDDGFTGSARLLVAAYAGSTRLIDNIAVSFNALVG